MMNDAFRLECDHEYALAENLVREAVKIFPGVEIAHYRLGQLLFKQGLFKEAEEAFKKGRQICPNFSYSQVEMDNRCQALVSKGYDETIAQHLAEIYESLHDIKVALKSNPNLIYDLTRSKRGLIKIDAKRLHEKVELMKESE